MREFIHQSSFNIRFVINNIARKTALCEILSLLILSIFCIEGVKGQNYDLKDYKFSTDVGELTNPLVGGFSAPQLNKMDFNQDGIEDLLVFDRRGNVARSFINSGEIGSEAYTYAPRFQKLLPPLKGFVRIADYNGDNIPDVFTGPQDTGGSIAVYTGGYDGQNLFFDLVEVDDSIFPFDVLTVPSNGGFTNVYNSLIDVPAIVDIDNDGDLDILSFDAGGSYVAYYRNVAIEEGLDLSNLKYVLEDFCWGKFKEGGLDSSIFLSDNRNDCAEELVSEKEDVSRGGNVHAGSTVEVFDYQADGDYDLLLGDLTSNSLVLVINEPEGESAFATEFIAQFPADDIPVDLYVFPSSWILDVDNDGDEDLVVCPNEQSDGANIRNFWYYENISDTPVHDFQLIEKDFLNNTSIDLGTDSNPCFLDYNQDGLLDLLVGTSGEYDDSGQEIRVSMYLYENVGTMDIPSYSLVDDDWLKYSDNTMFSLNPAPAVGDLDGDGDDDIIVGDNNGFLFYYENIAGPNNPYEFAQAVYQFMDLDVGQHVHPYIFDYNQDGLGDLFIGEKNTNSSEFGFGSVNYFQNMGSIGEPLFDRTITSDPNTLTFGLIKTVEEGFQDASTAPVVFELADRLLVLCGTESGKLKLFEANYDNPNAEFELIDEFLGSIVEGEETSVDLADIDNDGYLEIAVGNKRGGIAIYNTTLDLDGTVSTSMIEEKVEFKIYPNPTNKMLSVESDSSIELIEIFDVHGKKVFETRSASFNISELTPGAYSLIGTFIDGVNSQLLIIY